MSRIIYKNQQEVERIRAAGYIVSTVLAELRDRVAPGVSTLELDSLAFDIIKQHGGTPSFLNHRAGQEVYHHSTCISVNEEVVHGIPSAERKLKDGDLVSIDVGVKLKGFHGDSAITVPVGKVSKEAQRLLDVTKESLYLGLEAIKWKGRLQDIGRAVQEYVERHGFTVVRELSGHGIGRQLWEPPSIPNYVDAQASNPQLLEGMALAIEPMVNAGNREVGTLPDGWTVVTADGKYSAHFEHTVVVTRTGCDVLTLGPHDPGPWPRIGS
jgi:methionyl aminopeptidase